MNLFNDISMWTGAAYDLTSTTGPSSGGNAIKATLIQQGLFANFQPVTSDHDATTPVQLTVSFAFQKGTVTWLRVRTIDNTSSADFTGQVYLNLDELTVGTNNAYGTYSSDAEFEHIRFYDHPVDATWTKAEIVLLVPAGTQQSWYWYTVGEDGGNGNDAGILNNYVNIAEASLISRPQGHTNKRLLLGAG